jgi:hypothetical protein
MDGLLGGFYLKWDMQIQKHSVDRGKNPSNHFSTISASSQRFIFAKKEKKTVIFCELFLL